MDLDNDGFLNEQTESAITQLAQQISFFYSKLNIEDVETKGSITIDYSNTMFQLIFVEHVKNHE